MSDFKGIKRILAIVVVTSIGVHANAQKDVWMGGSLGISLPSNAGRSDGQVGFNDVARPGMRVAFTGRWFYGKRLSLGWDLGWQHHNQEEAFWNVNNYGDVENKYNAYHLLVEGNYYFSHDAVKPYCGITFGAFFLSNSLTFESAYPGTDADASASYHANQWNPGFMPQAGVLIDLSRNAMLDIKGGFELIPNLAESKKRVYENDRPRDITMNPHGNQNQWVFSIGLLFLI